jgi:hypothetical protein
MLCRHRVSISHAYAAKESTDPSPSSCMLTIQGYQGRLVLILKVRGTPYIRKLIGEFPKKKSALDQTRSIQGVAVLSSVLRNKRGVQFNIEIRGTNGGVYDLMPFIGHYFSEFEKTAERL